MKALIGINRLQLILTSELQSRRVLGRLLVAMITVAGAVIGLSTDRLPFLTTGVAVGCLINLISAVVRVRRTDPEIKLQHEHL